MRHFAPFAHAAGRYLSIGVVGITGYYLLPLAGLPAAVRVGWYVLICASGAVAVLIGVVRLRPARRAPWYLLAIGQFIYAAADLAFYLDRTVFGIDRYPYYDDLLYLASYPLLAAGLLGFVRIRTPGWDLPSAIDSGIVSLVAGLLLWVFVVSPAAFTPDESRAAQWVTIAYPAMDLLLLTVGLRLALGAGSRTTALRLLYASTVVMFEADTIYGYQQLSDSYLPGGVLEGMWLLVALLLGASALHPSMRRLTEPTSVAAPDTSPGRLALLGIASTMAPTVLLIQHLRGAPPHVLAVALSCMALFPLTLARMATLVVIQRRIAITDALTGLRTRRYFEQRLADQVAASPRNQASVGLLLLDIDHFKRINDAYGHPAGDEVLRAVGRILTTAVRSADLAARYGGEEFAVLLPGVGPAEVAGFGERVRVALAGAPIATGEGHLLTVTASIGAACLPQDAATADQLVVAADRALYLAKEQGRNRVVVGWVGQPAALPGAAGRSIVDNR